MKKLTDRDKVRQERIDAAKKRDAAEKRREAAAKKRAELSVDAAQREGWVGQAPKG